MNIVKLQWNGEQDTLIRQDFNGNKVPLKVGQAIEVEEKLAEFYSKSDKKFVILKELSQEPKLKQPKPRTPKRAIPNK